MEPTGVDAGGTFWIEVEDILDCDRIILYDRKGNLSRVFYPDVELAVVDKKE